MEYSALIRGQKTVFNGKSWHTLTPPQPAVLTAPLLLHYSQSNPCCTELLLWFFYFLFLGRSVSLMYFLKGLISVVPQVVSESWAALLQRWTMCAKCASAHRVEHVGCNKYHIIIYSRLIILQIGAGDVYTNSPERIQLNVRITKMSVIQLYSHIFDS